MYLNLSLKTRNEKVPNSIHVSRKMVFTQLGKNIVLRSENGGEYLEGQLKENFKEHGIIHQNNCACNRQGNVVKWKNQYPLKVELSYCWV